MCFLAPSVVLHVAVEQLARQALAFRHQQPAIVDRQVLDFRDTVGRQCFFAKLLEIGIIRIVAVADRGQTFVDAHIGLDPSRELDTRGRNVGQDPGQQDHGCNPERHQYHQRIARTGNDRRHEHGSANPDQQVASIAEDHQQGLEPHLLDQQRDGRESCECRRGEKSGHCRVACQLAGQELSAADALCKHHAQLALLPFARDAAEGEEYDEQRHQCLQNECRRQHAEAQQYRRLPCIAEVGRVLPVAFQVQGMAGKWVDTEVKERKRVERPEHVVTVMDDPMWMAVRLRIPLLVRSRLIAGAFIVNRAPLI